MRSWAATILADPHALRRLTEADDDRQAVGPDVLPPIALSWLRERRDAVRVSAASPPSPDWVPASIRIDGPDAGLAWTCLGGERPREPFFETTLRTARRRIVNRLIDLETPLRYVSLPPHARMPDGFVFHMSRSGSTLVSQAVAHLADSVSISESPAIDTALRIATGMTETDSTAMLRAVVAAHAGGGTIAPGRFVVKLDSWHVPFLPVLTRVFPGTPWIFLTRDPVEILVSHRRRPGVQAVPGMLSGVPGLSSLPPRPQPDHLAAILGALCATAARHRLLGHGIVVDYAELPRALEDRILPHFGIVTDAADRDSLGATLANDAKLPMSVFVPDGAGKRAEADAALLDAAARLSMPSYRRLLDA